MDSGRVLCAVIGFSASILLCMSNLKKWQKQQTVEEKLRIISEALDHAEERLIRFQERHDRILNQISSYYFCNQEFVDALVNARTAMNEALEFTVNLREMQIKLIRSYPDGISDVFLR